MASYLAPEDIEDQAATFLRKHHPQNTIPIPIEEIIDIKLRVNIVPVANLMRSHELDGFITRDLSSIYIDLELYDNIDRNFRARNTLAHEIGHLVLHVEYYRSSNIESVEDWKRLQRDNRELHNNLETQARMFAPCLLMPPDHLERLFEEQKKLLVEHGVEQHLPADTLIASYVASQIGRAFSVSEQSAEYRLKNWLERRG